MKITIKDVEYISQLAKLEFTEAEKEKYTYQLNQILEYMEQLNKLDTSNVEPLSHVIELVNVHREDTVIRSLDIEDALKNAPAKTEKFFRVPKVISEKS